MTETPRCEHCGEPLNAVYVKTSVFRSYVPELNEYLNLEKNWDGEGEIWEECTQCRKVTDKTKWTDDGRLIPTPTMEEQVNRKLKDLSSAILKLKPKRRP